jgi:hypothetical protein
MVRCGLSSYACAIISASFFTVFQFRVVDMVFKRESR